MCAQGPAQFYRLRSLDDLPTGKMSDRAKAQYGALDVSNIPVLTDIPNGNGALTFLAFRSKLITAATERDDIIAKLLTGDIKECVDVVRPKG